MSSSGRFHCGKHDFRTDDLEEWRKHEEEEVHTVNGTAPCNYCGESTQFSFTGKKLCLMPPALCNDCRQKIEQTKQNM